MELQRRVHQEVEQTRVRSGWSVRRTLAELVAGTAERFDVMASVPSRTFPGGTLLRWPGLVAGMLFYSLRDRLG